MSKTVDVKVELLDDDCVNCPLISIEKEVLHVDCFDERTISIHRCSNLNFCENIYKRHIKKEN